uniref:Uncharacterized protein n=1 Tax=Anguilla anguilla TaxID=7936 RepID=A0A0E9Q725_ANGAN
MDDFQCILLSSKDKYCLSTPLHCLQWRKVWFRVSACGA